MATKKKYDLKIGLKKLGIHAGIVLLAGLAAVYGESHFYLAIAPILEFALNWLKHRK